MSTSQTETSLEVQRLLKDNNKNNNIKIIPFCVPLPQNTDLHFEFDDTPPPPPPNNPKKKNKEAMSTNPIMMDSRGVVGTITVANASAVIWFGWGAIVPKQQQQQQQQGESGDEIEGGDQQIGKGLPQMGPMAVSMPRTTYSSSSSTPHSSIKEAPSSQLIGGANEEDMLTGIQMSSRLSSKLSWPIFVSCAIHSDLGCGAGGAGEGGGMGGLGAGYGGLLSQKAAALAEKEIGCILMEEKKKKERQI